MAAVCVYGDRQMQIARAASGLSCRRRLVPTVDAVIIGTGAPTHWRPQRRTTRAISAPPDFRCLLASVPQSLRVSHRVIRQFSDEFDEDAV
jgi:hypothetical protein